MNTAKPITKFMMLLSTDQRKFVFYDCDSYKVIIVGSRLRLSAHCRLATLIKLKTKISGLKSNTLVNHPPVKL